MYITAKISLHLFQAQTMKRFIFFCFSLILMLELSAQEDTLFFSFDFTLQRNASVDSKPMVWNGEIFGWTNKATSAYAVNFSQLPDSLPKQWIPIQALFYSPSLAYASIDGKKFSGPKPQQFIEKLGKFSWLQFILYPTLPQYQETLVYWDSIHPLFSHSKSPAGVHIFSFEAEKISCTYSLHLATKSASKQSIHAALKAMSANSKAELIALPQNIAAEQLPYTHHSLPLDVLQVYSFLGDPLVFPLFWKDQHVLYDLWFYGSVESLKRIPALNKRLELYYPNISYQALVQCSDGAYPIQEKKWAERKQLDIENMLFFYPNDYPQLDYLHWSPSYMLMKNEKLLKVLDLSGSVDELTFFKRMNHLLDQVHKNP